MAMTKKMENMLKGGCIRIYDGMIVVWPQYSQEEALHTEWVPKFNGRFATNNSTVAFVVDNVLYATPRTYEVLETLKDNGIYPASFYVPFSNQDFPKSESYKWMSLMEKAKLAWKKEFEDDCIEYCEKNGIHAISDETLANCFEMPECGVHVKHLYYEQTLYPVISGCLDSTAISKIGKYCSNNGRVVFVYINGKTYVAKGYKIISELESAGFKKGGIYVPFSNGEVITNMAMAARWDAISK